MMLAEYLHRRSPHVPVIVESQETANRGLAEMAGYTFLDKNSKTLPIDLRKAVSRRFGFGDFIVCYPGDDRELMRFRKLKDLQNGIFDIPSDLLMSLCTDNSISRWLYSRALFPIADALKNQACTDVDDDQIVRRIVFRVHREIPTYENRGVVAVFKRENYDRYSNFARIGQGSMGGKDADLLSSTRLSSVTPVCEDFQGVQVTIPHTVVVCTDIFDEFMDANNLYPIAPSDVPDQVILDRFQGRPPGFGSSRHRRVFRCGPQNRWPSGVHRRFEDSHYQPFAGYTQPIWCLSSKTLESACGW